MASYSLDDIELFKNVRIRDKISGDCLFVSIGMIIFWGSYLTWVMNRLS